ncbi:TPA: cyclic lactone autoinducer peptide AgrD [Neisseria subflava]
MILAKLVTLVFRRHFGTILTFIGNIAYFSRCTCYLKYAP